jgi:Protein of unknown function (DUF2029).
MRINIRRVFYITGLISLALCCSLLWLRMITSKAERTGSDFIALYAAGRVARLDGMSKVYDPLLQQAVEQEQVGFELVPGQVLLYNHVPYLVPVLWLIAGKSYLVSFIVWSALLVLFYGIGAWILIRIVHPGHPYNWLCAAAILTFYPLFISLMDGQDTAFVFLGLCLWLAGLLSGDDCMAGLGLSLTTVRPQLAVLLAVPFLFRRRKVAWFCVGVGILGLVSLAAVGLQGMRGFFIQILVSASGEWYGLKEALMVNLVGLLWRIAPALGGEIIHGIGWTFYGFVLVGLCVLWARSREIGEKQIVFALTLALFASPHLHYHDLTFLLVALIAGTSVIAKRGFIQPRDTAMGPLSISVILLLGSLVPTLKYNIPYVLMVLIVLIAWYPEKFNILWKRKVEIIS